MKRTLGFIFLCLLLSGCGFHFRHNEVITPPVKTIYIQDNTDSRSGLVFALRQNLQAMGVRPVNQATLSPVTLVIMSDVLNQSSTPLGNAQQLNAQTLSYSVKVALQDTHGKTIKIPTTLNTQITFWQNANQILGDTNAIQSLKENMIRDMTQKILAYLRANEKNEKNET
jgi:outer membrane lipopolysaccharide assembly protein LptE/RlpB